MKGNFLEITETAHGELPQKAAYSEHSIAGYVTAVLALSMANSVPWRRAVSLTFKKRPPAMSLHFTHFCFKQTFVFDMCMVRSSIVNLCPKI